MSNCFGRQSKEDDSAKNYTTAIQDYNTKTYQV